MARPDALTVMAEIYLCSAYADKIPECEQALARDNFQVFAGLQGVRDCFGHTDVGYFFSPLLCVGWRLYWYRWLHRPVETNTLDMLEDAKSISCSGYWKWCLCDPVVALSGPCWNPEVANASSICTRTLSIFGGLATLEQWPICLPAWSNIVHCPNICGCGCLELRLKSSRIWTGEPCASNKCLPQKSDGWRLIAMTWTCKMRCRAFWRTFQRSESCDNPSADMSKTDSTELIRIGNKGPSKKLGIYLQSFWWSPNFWDSPLKPPICEILVKPRSYF